MTSTSSSSTPASPATALRATPTVEQQKVLDRIAVQRERLRSRRAARAQALAQARSGGDVGSGMDGGSLALRAAAFAREHPAAVAVLAGAALMAGPRRLIRWAGVVLPIVLRMRRP